MAYAHSFQTLWLSLKVNMVHTNNAVKKIRRNVTEWKSAALIYEQGCQSDVMDALL